MGDEPTTRYSRKYRMCCRAFIADEIGSLGCVSVLVEDDQAVARLPPGIRDIERPLRPDAPVAADGTPRSHQLKRHDDPVNMSSGPLI